MKRLFIYLATLYALFFYAAFNYVRSAETCTISWQHSKPSNVSFSVYRNNELIGTTSALYLDMECLPGEYQISAERGVVQVYSNTVTVTQEDLSNPKPTIKRWRIYRD